VLGIFPKVLWPEEPRSRLQQRQHQRCDGGNMLGRIGGLDDHPPAFNDEAIQRLFH
jgi:hypothetical protein